MRQAIVVYGVGGFGREVALCLKSRQADFDLVGFVDDSAAGERRLQGVPVVEGFDAFTEFVRSRESIGVFIGIGNIEAHKKLVQRIERLRSGVLFPNVVHPDATVVDEQVTMGTGNYVGPGARMTADVSLGSFNIININAVLAHDVKLGDRCQVNPGAVLNGQDELGDEVVVGAGAVVMPRVKVGSRAVIAVGAVVGKDVGAGETVAGNPARVIRRAESKA